MAPVDKSTLATVTVPPIIKCDKRSTSSGITTSPIKTEFDNLDESNHLNEFRSLLASNVKTKDYDLDDVVCLKFLRSRDYNLRESLKVLSGFLAILDERPDIFSWSDSIIKVIASGMFYHYPVKAPNGCKLLINHPGVWNVRSFNIENIISTTLFFDEISLFDDDVQRNGFIGIIDMRGMGWSHIYNVGLTNAKLASDLTDKYIPFKVVNLHVVFENRLTDLAYSLFKPFLDDKLKNRIVFHGHNLSSLYKYVPQSCLPPSLGGTNVEYPPDHYIREVESKKDQVLSLWESLKKKRVNNN